MCIFTSRFQHLRLQHSFCLQGCNILPHPIIQFGVVAFRYQFIYLFGEGFHFLQLQADGFLFGLSLSGAAVGYLLPAILQALSAFAQVGAFELVQAIPVPLVYNDIRLKALMLPAAEVPDKRRFGQVHKQVEVITEVPKEILLNIFVNGATNQSIQLHDLSGAKTLTDQNSSL